MDGVNAEAIREIVGLANKAQLPVEVDGKSYWPGNPQPIIFDPRPGSFGISSLSAIVEYIKGNKDGFKKEELIIIVESPEKVSVWEKVMGESQKRTLVIVASLDNDVTPFPFSDWLPQEMFIITASALFEETKDKDAVIKAASCMIAEVTLKGEDNGATMQYEAKNGVVLPSGTKAPTVVELKPFRTFRQVEQPESKFIFRYRSEGDSIKVNLIEADGGAWKHTAMESIKEYFKKDLPDVTVLA